MIRLRGEGLPHFFPPILAFPLAAFNPAPSGQRESGRDFNENFQL